MSHIVAQLIDDKENPVLTGERELSIEVGEGLKLLGVDNGNPKNVQSYQANKIVTSKGRALLIVQSVAGKAGSFSIKVGGEGITEAAQDILVK